jgi:hypothetical protein
LISASVLETAGDFFSVQFKIIAFNAMLEVYSFSARTEPASCKSIERKSPHFVIPAKAGIQKTHVKNLQEG